MAVIGFLTTTSVQNNLKGINADLVITTAASNFIQNHVYFLKCLLPKKY